WEGLGIIRRRRGDGTYLTARVQTSRGLVPTMVRLEGEALLRLIEVRRALENDVVRKATIHATPAQRTEISRLCDLLLVEVNAGRPWRKADHAFHGAIYDASGNPMFGQILQRLDHALERSAESPFGRDEFGLDSFPPHRELADAIVAADPARAVAAIDTILDIVEADVRAIITPDAE
ncbi:MAG TPA: FCD domain-containing protein, partial [Devosia sp.]